MSPQPRFKRIWNIFERIVIVVGFGFVVWDHSVIKTQLAELNAELNKEIRLAVATDPDRCTPLPSDIATTIKGYFSHDAPENLYAALLNGQDYYISRPDVVRPSRRQWSLDIYPGQGKWTLYFLIATTTQAQKDLKSWRDEKTPDGKPNYNNQRQDLPAGTDKYFVEQYTALPEPGK